MKRKKLIVWSVVLALFAAVALVWAGTPQQFPYGLRLKDEGAAHSTPPSGHIDLYLNSDVLYSIDDAGNITNLDTASAPALSSVSNPASDKTFTWADNYTLIFSFADTNEDMMTIKGVGAFGDVSVLKVESSTGNPTDGTVLEVVSHDANVDPLVVSTSGQAGVLTVGQGGTVSIVGNTDITGTLSVTGTFYQSALASASSGNTNLTIDAAGTGTITLGGTSTGLITTDNTVQLYGAVDIGNAATDTLTITSVIDGDVTLDDGSGDSPGLIFKDATDETMTIAKVDGSHLTFTPSAATKDVQVLTSNLRVGNGAPGTAAMDGEDFYVNGDSEFDGAVQFDGAVTAASTLAVTGTISGAGNVTLDDNSGASPSLIFQDATNETAIFSKADAGYLSITTVAGDGVSVLTGNFKVGAGSPDVSLDGTDAYVTGTFEVDGLATFDGGLDVDAGVDIDLATNATLVDVANAAADLAAGAGVLTVYGSNASGQTNASYLIRGAWKANGDAQDGFILFEDNSTGAAGNGDDMFKVDSGGSITTAGNITGSGATILAGIVKSAEVTAADNVLAASECGKVVFFSHATEFDNTLPAISTVTAGCTFRFIVGAAPDGDNYRVLTGNSLENVIYGLVVVDGSAVAGATEDTITFANGAAVRGDWVEVVTDGTYWYVSGQGVGAGAITLTQAD